MAKFCAMFSGSSGNCTFVSSGGSSLLIDAGVSARAICTALESIGSNIKEINAIFITHEHIDHIRGLKTLLSKYSIPVFANLGTINGILESLPLKSECFNVLKTGDCVDINGLKVSSFGTSHDSQESVGFRIHTYDGARIAVATDLGFVSDTVMGCLSDCNIVMIESNHDVGMLQNGKYPYYLKRRIMSKTGHLSNEECAGVLPELCRSGSKHFVLAHLSHDNNFPELALETALTSMKMSGIASEDYQIEVAPRSGPENVLTV
jgi:phosphoribosyl 1,2-cyclic phosphodiesterase